jgi:hypothetical protein
MQGKASDLNEGRSETHRGHRARATTIGKMAD